MTSAPQAGMPGPSDENDIMARLNKLRADAEKSVTNLEALQEQLSAIVTLPDAKAVTATIDAEGRLTALEIDRFARASLDGEALGYEINLAIAHAAAEQPPRDPQAAAEELRAQPGIDLEALMKQIFANSAAPAQQFDEPPIYWNDDRTVGFRIVLGSIRSMEFKPSWLAAASESTISTEIIRVAGLAREDEARRRIEQGE